MEYAFNAIDPNYNRDILTRVTFIKVYNFSMRNISSWIAVYNAVNITYIAITENDTQGYLL